MNNKRWFATEVLPKVNFETVRAIYEETASNEDGVKFFNNILNTLSQELNQNAMRELYTQAILRYADTRDTAAEVLRQSYAFGTEFEASVFWGQDKQNLIVMVTAADHETAKAEMEKAKAAFDMKEYVKASGDRFYPIEFLSGVVVKRYPPTCES